jgi:hypothetical protein
MEYLLIFAAGFFVGGICVAVLSKSEEGFPPYD